MAEFKISNRSNGNVSSNNNNSGDEKKNIRSEIKIKIETTEREAESKQRETAVTTNYWRGKLNTTLDRTFAERADQAATNNSARLYSVNSSTAPVIDGGGGGTQKPFMTSAEYQAQAANDPRLQIPEGTGNPNEDAQIVGEWLADAPPEMRGEMLHRLLEDGLTTDSEADRFAFLSHLPFLEGDEQAAVTDAFDRALRQSPSEFSGQLKNLAVELGSEDVDSQQLGGLSHFIMESGSDDLQASFAKGLLEGARDNDLPFLGAMASNVMVGMDDRTLRSFVNRNHHLMSTLVETATNQAERTGVNSGNVLAEILNRLTDYSTTPGLGEQKLFAAIFSSDSVTDSRHYGEMAEAVRNFAEKFPNQAVSALRSLPSGADGSFLSPETMNRLEELGVIPDYADSSPDEIAGWLNDASPTMQAEYMHWMMQTEAGREVLNLTGSLSPEQQGVFAEALNAAYEVDPEAIGAQIEAVGNEWTFGRSSETGNGFSEIIAATGNAEIINLYVENRLAAGDGSITGQQAYFDAATALKGLNLSELETFLAGHFTGSGNDSAPDAALRGMIDALNSPAYAGDAFGAMLDTLSTDVTPSAQALNVFELAVKGGSSNPNTEEGVVNFFAENPTAVADWAGTNTDNQNTLVTFFEKFVLSHDPKDADDPISQKIFGAYKGVDANGLPIYEGGALNELFTDLKNRMARTSDPAVVSRYGYEMGAVLGAFVEATERVQADSDAARELNADRFGAFAAALSTPITITVRGAGFSVSDLVGQLASEVYLGMTDPSDIQNFGETFKQEFFNRLQAELNDLEGKPDEFEMLETFFDALDRGYNAVND